MESQKEKIKCLRCNRTKAKHLFGKGGKGYYCKKCVTNHSKESRAKLKDSDYIKYKSQQFRSNWVRRARQHGVSLDEIPKSTEIASWLQTQLPFKCFFTGQDLGRDFGVDHKVPIARGGSFSLDNLCITNISINGAKGVMTSEEFSALLKVVLKWEDKGEALLRRLMLSNVTYNKRGYK